jgi:hypothetical protein
MTTYNITTPIADLPFRAGFTQEKLKSVLNYDADTGVFHWIVSRSNGSKAGDIAGSIDSCGYVVIGVFGKVYLAHRLAWLYMIGVWPEDQIDHKNMNRSDNRWENIRIADKTVNGQNIKKARKHNKTGYLGVHVQKGKFKAQIKVDKKPMHLGYFETAELAHQAYIDAKRKYHAGCMI